VAFVTFYVKSFSCSHKLMLKQFGVASLILVAYIYNFDEMIFSILQFLEDAKDFNCFCPTF